MALTLPEGPDCTEGLSTHQGVPVPCRVSVPCCLQGCSCSGHETDGCAHDRCPPQPEQLGVTILVYSLPNTSPTAKSLIWLYSFFLPWCPWKPASRWGVSSEAWGTTDGNFLSSPAEPKPRLQLLASGTRALTVAMVPGLPSTSLSQGSSGTAKGGTLQLSFSTNIPSCNFWPTFI